MTALTRQCVYCRCATTSDEGEAHVLPEAVVQNRLILAPGTVCDGCNNYLSKLDSALVTHPLIAWGIQAFALPGKTGKPRVRLGSLSQSSDSGSQLLALDQEAVQRLTRVDGRPYVVLTPLNPVKQRRFHRALHHVGFNLLCKIAGSSEALSSTYDPVRQYVRQPQQGELWPFYYASLGPNAADIVDIMYFGTHNRVLLQFFNHAFAVDLLASGRLHQELGRLLPELTWSVVPTRPS